LPPLWRGVYSVSIVDKMISWNGGGLVIKREKGRSLSVSYLMFFLNIIVADWQVPRRHCPGTFGKIPEGLRD
jgi:hypothetical protein